LSNLSSTKVDLIERLTDICLKVILFGFVLLGITVLTAFFIYCVMNDKGVQAKAISGYCDALFATAFIKLIWHYFVKPKQIPASSTVALQASASDSDYDEE